VPSIALLVFLSYKGIGYAGDFGYIFGGLLLTVPWFIYRREWRKNADEFLPDIEVEPNPSDEGIRYEWELTYIANRRKE
jgi:hypothetical protein